MPMVPHNAAIAPITAVCSAAGFRSLIKRRAVFVLYMEELVI